MVLKLVIVATARSTTAIARVLRSRAALACSESHITTFTAGDSIIELTDRLSLWR